MATARPVARAQFINGLRDLASFLAAHVGYPVPDNAEITVFPDGDDYAERLRARRPPRPGPRRHPGQQPRPLQRRTRLRPHRLPGRRGLRLRRAGRRRMTPPATQADQCTCPVRLHGRVDHIDGGTGELLHRYTTVHEPGGVLLDRLQDPPRLPLPALRRGLPRRHLPAHPRGPDRRQRRPRHGRRPPVPVRHPHRAVIRPGPRPPGERRPGPALPTAPQRQAPARTASTSSCNEQHATPTTPGSARRVCADCYDYTGAVLFNASAPELWRRFTIDLRAHPRPHRRHDQQGTRGAASGSPSPRSPSTRSAASSTSTPSSASTARTDPTHRRPPWATADLLDRAVSLAAANAPA